jgi:hydrogenase maturation protease
MTEIKPSLKTLIIGYGNPGRQDDGIGPAFIDTFPEESNKIALQSNYQLTVEDALELKNYEQVIFVDASINCNEPFHLEEITATNNSGFGSHSLTPHALIQLCQTLYQHSPAAYILAIRGYEFDQFEEKLSATANDNLKHALTFLTSQFNA